MAISPISSNSHTIPQPAQAALNEQVAHMAAHGKAGKTAPATPKNDTVSISKQAVLMNSPNYSAAEEATESPAEKAIEKLKGQR